MSDIVPDYDQSPPIGEDDVVSAAPGIDIWDAWPVQQRDGKPVTLPDGAEIWMALAAPHFPNPDERHGHARIHLFRREDHGWHHLGPAMPDGFSPGSREWSGSAVHDPHDDSITLYFTAAGRRGEAETSFEQRMFSAKATLTPAGHCESWRDLKEVVAIDRLHYMPTTEGGAIGTIKAFRDPFYFRDPASGAHYLYFAGSQAGSASAFNGVIGIATAAPDRPDDWRTQPPSLSADGLNNELERPHVVIHGGLYYLFWSTQRHVFDPAGPTGPTGLYGAVSERPDGGWRMLNGSGLVFANPASSPAQAYSWMVLPDLSVTSFIDNWGTGPDRRFGGCFAPFLHLALNQDRALLENGRAKG
ncbi:glycoside hydrolase family 68 protein [Sphingobium sp. Sx8-8]|uniref:glycoside hydrolase family 68 protein n=1 Tax=Sphingobium sp. Sx8-8 TaxID=2933617 RepID=UPI001F5A1D26